ncbi:MAG TPA: hypothetical protein ENN67_07620, partial [Firmicutes bacterium]|nr:hypothetical protein [Bacillota bacterium]
MTTDQTRNAKTGTEPAAGKVGLAISKGLLSDLVELTLRLDGIKVRENKDEPVKLIITDQKNLEAAPDKTASTRILLLVSDESDITSETEYLVVPETKGDFDLDPELLVRKVREMLSGRRPSTER